MADRTFTTEQQAVVDHRAGHALVSAVAGSGKTTVLVERIARLVRAGEDPSRILVIQFNKAAQLQFAARLKRRLGEQEAPDVRTFHSVGLGLCKRLVDIGKLPPAKTPKGPLQDKLARIALRDAWRAALGDNEYPSREVVDEFRQFMTLVKAQTRPAREFFSRHGYPPQHRPFIDAFDRFEQARHEGRFRFFDDMLADPVLALLLTPALWAPFVRFDHILVDEAQDMSEIQYELVKGIAGDRANLMFVGDVDQCIYSWRGSDPSFLIETFARDFAPCTRYPMTYTFRFGPSVALFASHLITKNVHRDDKLVIAHPRNPNTAIRRLPYQGIQDSGLVRDIEPLFRGKQLRSAMVLARYYSSFVPYEIELARAGIPFHVVGRVPLVFVPEIACLVAALAITTNHWPVDDELREVFLQATLTVPTLYLPEQLPSSLAAEMAELSFTSPRDIHRPLLQCARTFAGSNQRLAQRLRERADALSLLASGALAGDKPEVVMGAYVRLTGLREHIANQGARTDEVSELRANVEAFMALAGSYENTIELLDMLGPLAAHREEQPPTGDFLPLLSIHRAKGLEARTVYVVGLASGNFPRAGGGDDDAEEERRLAYVAVTRPTHELVLLHPSDQALDAHVGDIAAHPKPGELRVASPYLYDGEIGLARSIADAIHSRLETEICCRDPRVAARYLVQANIIGIQLTAAAAPARPLRRLTPKDTIRPGMQVWTERHGVCQVLKHLYGPVYALRDAEGNTTHDALPNNAWVVPQATA